MIGKLNWKGHDIAVDFGGGTPVAIPIDPHGAQPSFFSDVPASAAPLRLGRYVGDMRQGGSCNAEVIRLAPHCHGTHTECVGHLRKKRLTVQQTIYPGPVLARLVSLRGTPAEHAGENYPVLLDAADRVMTRSELQETVRGLEPMGIEGLLVRTLPNDREKLTRDYARSPEFPVFSSEAMHWIALQPLKHLLVDTPSLDRPDDGGRLANHRTWWGLDGTMTEIDTNPARRSVTELIYVPDALPDGLYWLHLELSPVVSDATPSRPVLYPVEVLAA